MQDETSPRRTSILSDFTPNRTNSNDPDNEPNHNRRPSILQSKHSIIQNRSVKPNSNILQQRVAKSIFQGNLPSTTGFTGPGTAAHAEEAKRAALQKKRNQLLTSIDGVDKELVTIEAELSRLNTQYKQINDRIQAHEEEETDQKQIDSMEVEEIDDPDSLPYKKAYLKAQEKIFQKIGRPRPQLIWQKVLYENHKIVKETHKSMDKLGVCYPLPKYIQPSDVPCYDSILLNAQKSFSNLTAYLSKQQKARYKRKKYMTVKQTERQKIYNSQLEEYLNSTKNRNEQAVLFWEKYFPEVKRQREQQERDNLLRRQIYDELHKIPPREVEEVKEEKEQPPVKKQKDEKKEVVPEPSDESKIMEDEKKLQYKLSIRKNAIIPAPLLDEEERKLVPTSTCLRIEDPHAVYKQHTHLNTWTEQEKNIFKEQYLIHQKSFALYSGLPSKTPSDLVLYYYLTKHHNSSTTNAYKQLLKKNQQSRLRNRNNQLANTRRMTRTRAQELENESPAADEDDNRPDTPNLDPEMLPEEKKFDPVIEPEVKVLDMDEETKKLKNLIDEYTIDGQTDWVEIGKKVGKTPLQVEAFAQANELIIIPRKVPSEPEKTEIIEPEEHIPEQTVALTPTKPIEYEQESPIHDVTIIPAV